MKRSITIDIIYDEDIGFCADSLCEIINTSDLSFSFTKWKAEAAFCKGKPEDVYVKFKTLIISERGENNER